MSRYKKNLSATQVLCPVYFFFFFILVDDKVLWSPLHITIHIIPFSVTITDIKFLKPLITCTYWKRKNFCLVIFSHHFVLFYTCLYVYIMCHGRFPSSFVSCCLTDQTFSEFYCIWESFIFIFFIHDSHSTIYPLH